jgi:cardiolipin synthase (CMP-forming)
MGQTAEASSHRWDCARYTHSLIPAWINLPNLFTLIRFVLTPVVAWAILADRMVVGILVFGAAAFTDYLDGASARHLGQSTASGAVLDPLADKCLLSGIFLALAAAGMVPWWLVGIIFGRDVYILLGAGVLLLATPVRKFPPSIWGKVSTCVQIGTALVWMLKNIMHFRLVDGLATSGLWICSGFTLWSGVHYTWRGVQTVRAHPRLSH